MAHGTIRQAMPPVEPSAAALEIAFASQSDAGRVRTNNEDFAGHFAPADRTEGRSRGWLFVLADGVGGQDRGEVASRLAVETLIQGFRTSTPGDLLTGLLPRLVQAANTKVYEAGLAAESKGPAMATTLVACGLRHDRATVAHVGDSRCTLIRGGRATRLTRDHTLVEEQVRLGLLTEEDAAEAETRHVLSRSLGANLFVNVDIAEHQVFPGDALVLTCDGMHAPVRGEDMARVITPNCDLDQAAGQLVALAKERDGSDNITVQIVRVRSVERVGLYRGRPYRLR